MTFAEKKAFKLAIAKAIADHLTSEPPGAPDLVSQEVRYYGGEAYVTIICRDPKQGGPDFFTVQVKETL